MRLLFAMLAGIFLAGCTSVMDARVTTENADVCEIHHRFMETVRISSSQIGELISQEYLEARFRGFRHSYPVSLPRKAFRKYVIYLCDDCVRAEAAWKQQHPAGH